MTLAGDALGLLPLGKASSDLTLAAGVGADLGTGRDTVEAEGELGGGTTGRLCVEVEGAPVDVLDGVALEMVAGVGDDAVGEHIAGAGEDGRRGDAELNKGKIVGVRAEFAGLVNCVFTTCAEIQRLTSTQASCPS